MSPIMLLKNNLASRRETLAHITEYIDKCMGEVTANRVKAEEVAKDVGDLELAIRKLGGEP